MKGSTHLIIGCAVGVAAAAYYPFTLKNAALYITVSAFSALSADLDDQSMLTSKLGAFSRFLRELALWTSVLSIICSGYLYLMHDLIYPGLTAASIMILLLSLVTKEGIIRNALVSVIGASLIYTGWMVQMNWLIGFGLFVGCVPWFKHRGMSHTVWALILWGQIGLGLERQLQVEGIMLVSVAGYFSHLLADTITPNGVKWLFPLYKKSIKLRH